MSGLYLILCSVPALLAGLALGHFAKRRWDGLMPRWLPAAILVPGVLPIAWHFRRISDFIAPVSIAQQRSGAAAELEMLSLVLPFAVVGIWGLAILLVRRIPVFALAFPLLATWFYLTGVAQAAPLVRAVMDARAVWLSLLVAAQAPATIAVAGFLWNALGREGLVSRWPLRAR